MFKTTNMLLIQHTTTAQSVTIPRPKILPTGGVWAFKLTNGITRKEIPFVVEPVVNGMVLEVSITFAVLPDKGQYNYSLTRGGEVVSFGLAQIGQTTLQPTRKQYNPVIETIQYNG